MLVFLKNEKLANAELKVRSINAICQSAKAKVMFFFNMSELFWFFFIKKCQNVGFGTS